MLIPQAVIEAVQGAVASVYDNQLGSAAASWDITGLNQNYKSLLILINARTDEAVNLSSALLRFNNDSGSNYDVQVARARSTTITAVTSTTTSFGNTMPGSSNAAGVFGTGMVLLPNYATTVAGKSPILIHGYADETLANSSIEVRVGHWRDSSAVTRLTFLAGTGAASNFVAGSRLTIYGLV